MVPLFLLGVAILAGFLLAGRWLISAEPKALIRSFKWLLLGIIIAVVTLFVLSGRLGWAMASLPALLPWLLRIRAAHGFYRMFMNFRNRGAGFRPGRPGGGPGNAPGPMTRDRALKILGLEGGAGKEEIKAAHHRLISSLHPDKGGSDYLAAEINQAKDVLLGK